LVIIIVNLFALTAIKNYMVIYAIRNAEIQIVYTLLDQLDQKGVRLCVLDDNKGSVKGGGDLLRRSC
jgi:hypothetical protein